MKQVKTHRTADKKIFRGAKEWLAFVKALPPREQLVFAQGVKAGFSFSRELLRAVVLGDVIGPPKKGWEKHFKGFKGFDKVNWEKIL